MEKTTWLKETARDFLAVGSWIFYILVVGRSLIEPYREFADPTVIAGIVLLLAEPFRSYIDGYTARALTLIFFTSMFYQDLGFTLFASVAGLGVIISSYAVGTKVRNIATGCLVGVVASAVGHFLSQLTLAYL